MQGIHMMVARRAGGGVTVPVLVTPDGVLGESEQILAWVDERTPAEHRLYPAEPAERARGAAAVPALRSRAWARAPGASCTCTCCATSELMLRVQQRGRAAVGGPRGPVGLAGGRSASPSCAWASSRVSRWRTRPRCGASWTSWPTCSPTAGPTSAASASARRTSRSRRCPPPRSCLPSTARRCPSRTACGPTRPRWCSGRASTRRGASPCGCSSDHRREVVAALSYSDGLRQQLHLVGVRRGREADHVVGSRPPRTPPGSPSACRRLVAAESTICCA